MDGSFVQVVSLLAVVLLGVAIIYYVSRNTQRHHHDAAAHYSAGLSYLLSGEARQALQKFRDAVRLDTNLLDAYLKIGDILREHGNLEKAIKIHRDLTVRYSLTNTQRIDVLRSLVKDYQVSGQYDQALAVIQQILSLNHNDLRARQMELALHERRRDWDKAIAAFEKLNRIRGELQNGRVALYRVQKGLQLTQTGREKDARASFREALKIDPQCTPAYLYLTDSYLREERLDDAFETLQKFLKQVPQHAPLAFERLKEILFHIGEFGKIESIYNHFIEEHPDQKEAYLALAEIHEKKGELNRAIQLCQTVLENDPHDKPARRRLVVYFHKKGDTRRAIEQALQLITEDMAERNVFRCTQCGHESSEPFWLCPSCSKWETAIKS